MNSVTDYLRIFNDEEHKPLIEDYKKEMAYRLVRRDLEITYKELELCKLIGEVNFYSQREDELVGIISTICFLFNCPEEDLNEVYQELFIEGLYFGFFDMAHKEKSLSADDISNYAHSFTELLVNLATRKITHPHEDKKKAFFQEFNTYFPEQRINYFENNHKSYLLAN
jgi:hypothetical protein